MHAESDSMLRGFRMAIHNGINLPLLPSEGLGVQDDEMEGGMLVSHWVLQ